MTGSLSKDDVRISRLLSLVLRHNPERIGLTLDAQGWAEIDVLLEKLRGAGTFLPRERLERIVAENDKRRFAFSEDGARIRASQGHSVEIDLGLAPAAPPVPLYHGTALANLPSIREQGLIRGRRQQVHLSLNAATALKVGSRHGRPVVLVIDTEAMAKAGHLFYCSNNGVWLTDEVPAAYISFPDEGNTE